MTQSYDDPNRESLGLEPAWAGAGEPEPKAKKKSAAGKDESPKDEPVEAS